MVCQMDIDNEEYESFHNTLSIEPSSSQEADAIESTPLSNGETNNNKSPTSGGGGGGATVFQTSLNVGKMCMGPGTLALPFAAENGGLIFNIIGLASIGLWNYYSADCLLRCLKFLPQIDVVNNDAAEVKEVKSIFELEQQPLYGAIDSTDCRNKEQTKPEYDRMESMPPPPNGTTTYGAIAWYAIGPKGLMVLDLLMLSLFFGLLIAYEVAMQGFINDTPLTTGSKRADLIIPSAIIAMIACAPDMSFLAKFSGMGLLAVILSFVVISWQGIQKYGFSGFSSASDLNQWPASLSAASSWFGVVVFGFGVAPFLFNFRDSMADPKQAGLVLQIALSMVYVGYIAMSNGILVLFSPGGHIFEGDVLEAMPNTWISTVVRLLMAFAVMVSAPLIVVPFGELMEGKIGIDKAKYSPMFKRIAVRVTFCIICTLVAEFFGSAFVHIVSFIGCFSVSITSFVLPSLFIIQLSNQSKSDRKGGLGVDLVLLCDTLMLVVGVIATVITSTLTFRELMATT
mmetsp:Transcript_1619/g.3553  ORF Transcript_1619/g.3553 Transcript_1619/m.3553 type:complete len:513 (+) Transcript_1619:142-1680(+)|eukprot:CAMPEP_0196138840 /NCGR_PEP_ID=MMETSP0910-20130528/6333_1 /TAXON_ID=49265 /ORGANISM="Thalassiosira rotula, Strain GSO102" /LENGTH=512 /DNA_ID=CAMNT_0041399501 /DNA_START=179 /DNA_END=1717 /DNA_ORIENTATION=+